MMLWGGVIAGVGSVLAIVSMFLPWVESRSAQGLGPLVDLGLGLLGSDLTAVVDVVRDRAALTGLDLALRFDPVSTTVKVLAAAPAVLATLTLIVLVAGVLTRSRVRAVWIVLAILCGLAAIALLLASSTITRLGMGDNLITRSVVDLLGLTKGTGYWLAVAGMALIAAGLGIGSAASSSASSADDGWASQGSSWDW